MHSPASVQVMIAVKAMVNEACVVHSIRSFRTLNVIIIGRVEVILCNCVSVRERDGSDLEQLNVLAGRLDPVIILYGSLSKREME